MESPVPNDQERSWAQDMLDAALRFDAAAEQQAMDDLRRRHPDASPRELAAHVIRDARRWGAGIGLATGTVTVPWAAPVTGAVDAAALLRLQVKLAARIATLYDREFLEQPDARYELLAPIFGVDAVNDFLQLLAAPTVGRVTRTALRRYLDKRRLTSFRAVILRYLVKKTMARAAGKLVPVIGGVVSGSWYYMELKRVGERVCDYFEASPSGAEPPDS